MASSPSSQPVDTANLECGVCYELLLDPVVGIIAALHAGSCGHDFCRICLEKWRSQQRQQGREVRCPVCRGIFAESFEKLGVCVRLRDMVELLFPDKAAARRAAAEKQLAADRKRTATRVQQEDVPRLVTFPSSQTARSGRRRLHARRHNTQPAAAAAGTGTAATAGSPQDTTRVPAGGVTSTPTLPAVVGTAVTPITSNVPLRSAAPNTSPAAGGTSNAAGSQLILNLTANPSSSNTGNPSNYQLSAQQLHQVQAAMAAAAADQLQQFDTVMEEPQTVMWPILDVQFTMGWYEQHGRRGCRSSSRRCRRRAARA